MRETWPSSWRPFRRRAPEGIITQLRAASRVSHREEEEEEDEEEENDGSQEKVNVVAVQCGAVQCSARSREAFIYC